MRMQTFYAEISGIALGFSVIVSLIFTAMAIATPKGAMRIFTNDSELVKSGTEYLRIVGVSYTFLGISQILLTVMKNCGQATKSAVISSISMLLNILLNALFIICEFQSYTCGRYAYLCRQLHHVRTECHGRNCGTPYFSRTQKTGLSVQPDCTYRRELLDRCRKCCDKRYSCKCCCRRKPMQSNQRNKR